MKYKGLLNCSIGSALYQITISIFVIAFGLWEGLEPIGSSFILLPNLVLMSIFLYFLMKRNYWAYLIFFIVETLHLLGVTFLEGMIFHGYNILNFTLSLLGFWGMLLNEREKKKESFAS